MRIKFVQKENNPPAIPQCRPIEQLWAIIKAKVYANGWEANNVNDLEARIRKVIKNILNETYANLMRNVKLKIRRASSNGVLSVIN